ncbi:LysR family transcriptional regulator [Nonomuraea typhae]|uniref:LysR family transcriptional regulator n=1 Tax=Nonomuraea typhae TaxID=2603600 RepID=UPI0012FA47BF|nr:LysR family transcriptional regulator [Nonomuraea typhae]
MDLSLLRSFLAVYRTGSFTKAAGLLAISQPAVTGQIRNLESEVGQLLFLRTPRGAVPTESADELAREVSGPLDELESAITRRSEPAGISERTLSIAGPPEMISVRVLPALADLIGEGLRVRVSFGLTDDNLDGLTAGLHDLVIATSRPRQQGIVATPLMDEEFLLVGAPEHAKKVTSHDVDQHGAAALAGLPVIAYAENLPIVRRYWMTVFEERPAFTAQVVVPDLRAVLAAVKAGGGISVLPSYLCADELYRGDIQVMHEPEFAPLNTLFLATRAANTAGAILSTVQAHLLMKAQLWSAAPAPRG